MEPLNNRLFLDLDGVLANFDKRASQVLGGRCHYKYEFVHGPAALWKELDAVPDFFLGMDMMPGAFDFFQTVQHLDPVILTALPKTNPEEVAKQKRSWVWTKLGPGVPVITCKTHEKPQYCRAGDIIVDDRSTNRSAWEKKGGHYVLHHSFPETISCLKHLGVSI